MKKLNYELKQLCKNQREGSFATQRDRFKMLQLAANQLHKLGFRNMSSQSLKPKHIEALIEHWKSQEISTGTLKNRLSYLRWWAAKINKQNIVARSNAHYNIAKRQFVTNQSKACQVDQQALNKIRNPSIKLSLQLQQAFGLRREEAIKFVPSFADRGDCIVLKASWTKGGKERTIPVTSAEQRALLDQTHKLAGRGSMIPPTFTYVKQLMIYEKHTARAGFNKLHGLRHNYAQQRYEALTGWPCPVCCGPTHQQLSTEQRLQDKAARKIVSVELGHERLSVVAIYIGS